TGGRRACRLRLRVQLHTIIARKGDLRLANSKLKLSLNGYFHHLPPLSKLGARDVSVSGLFFRDWPRRCTPPLVGPPSRLLRCTSSCGGGFARSRINPHKALTNPFRPTWSFPRHFRRAEPIARPILPRGMR